MYVQHKEAPSLKENEDKFIGQKYSKIDLTQAGHNPPLKISKGNKLQTLTLH